MSIIGMDPGSDTLGVAALRVHLDSWKIVSSSALTLKGDKLARSDPWMDSVHGNRIARIAALEQALLAIFREVQPLEIASESPFINNRFPQAGIALTEVISAIRRAVMLYDIWKPLRLVDPPTVKNAVGVKGNKGGPEGKALMQQAVLALDRELNYQGTVAMDQLDEHSIDALAVAYCCYKNLQRELAL